MTKVSTKGLRFVSAIRLEGGEPADGFDRIQQNRNAMRRCNSKHIVDALEVHRIWGRDITWRRERWNTVECSSIHIAGGCVIA